MSTRGGESGREVAVSYLGLFQLAVPECILVLAALLVLLSDSTMRALEVRVRFIVGGMISAAGCVAAVVWMWIAPIPPAAPDGMLTGDPLVHLVQAVVLILVLFTIGLSIGSRFTTHVGEYLALVLLAAVGMLFLAGAENILMIFISLELTSLSLYILTAFDKGSMKSSEAALKYFLFGGTSAAFTLFGLSWVYGLTDATSLRGIAAAIQGRALDPMLLAAMVMVTIGFGFKVAAAPFHLWAPDAYQGAPTPSAALIASGSKVASFFILAKFMMMGFAGAEGSGALKTWAPGWVPAIATLAALSILLGNLAAIVQQSVRRLLAYSAIAHAGYMLIAIISKNQESIASLIYYAATYGATIIGAFGVVAVVEEATGDERLSDFAGLSRRAPVVSFCMMIFMLSLAGIPPLAGFFGKFYIFAAALKGGAPNLGLLWLVILALGMSAVSLYYYLQVLKQIYVADPPPGASPIKVPVFRKIVLCLLGILVVWFGCAPESLLRPILHAISLVAN